jgi:hypothetical protein
MMMMSNSINQVISDQYHVIQFLHMTPQEDSPETDWAQSPFKESSQPGPKDDLVWKRFTDIPRGKMDEDFSFTKPGDVRSLPGYGKPKLMARPVYIGTYSFHPLKTQSELSHYTTTLTQLTLALLLQHPRCHCM